MKTIVWLREDLRLQDNPALNFAAASGEILPVFIYPQGLGAASYWWLHQSLIRLQQEFEDHGLTLILRRGEPEQALIQIAKQTNAEAVVWNRVYSPLGIELGSRLKAACSSSQISTRSFNAQLLIEPTNVLNKQGTPFKVFTPFWRHCLSFLNPEPVAPLPKLTSFSDLPEFEALEQWGLLPKPDWAEGLNQRWQPGENGAWQRLETFLERTIDNYKEGRDFPQLEQTSMLSPHLAFGEISSKQIWCAVQERLAEASINAENAQKFLSEIGWREYSRYLLVHFPHIVDQPFSAKFDAFPWQDDEAFLKAWQQGKTGYPIIDAGMRELWHTGYMHNRVRMIVASFLTKHGMLHWKHGADWFWDTLVDADIANNTASWQWVAGCGADASPYFRIFNPILQGEKFDKEGVYIRKWVPELSKLDNRFINKPWEADPISLNAAEVELGVNYPRPIVDHKFARERALSSYRAVRANV